VQPVGPSAFGVQRSAFGVQPAEQRARRIEIAAVSLLALLLIVVLPALNAAGIVSDFTINLWGKYLCYALLAISVDLLWGFTGLLSLGQALFFALGGYMHGMYLMRMIGDLGQHKKPIPDFLVFLGWTELPQFWKPFASFPFALTMVFLLPAGIAYVFGLLAFRSRIKGVYFSILTQALTYGASLMFFRNNLLMGGNNGSPISSSSSASVSPIRDVSLAVYNDGRHAARRLPRVPLAERDEVRSGAAGNPRGREPRALQRYATAHYKLFVFVLAACIAAVGGALYVPQVGIINPSEMTPDKSLEAVVWCAVGGRGTLVGPILGAIGINALKSYATRAFPDLWLMILGGLFIVVVLFLPGGLVSVPARLRAGWQKLRRPAAVPPLEGSQLSTLNSRP